MLVLQLITRVTFPSGAPEFTTEFYLFYGDVSVARQLVSCVVFFYFICSLSVSCTECCLCLWIAAYEFWNVYLNVGLFLQDSPLWKRQNLESWRNTLHVVHLLWIQVCPSCYFENGIWICIYLIFWSSSRVFHPM